MIGKIHGIMKKIENTDMSDFPKDDYVRESPGCSLSAMLLIVFAILLFSAFKSFSQKITRLEFEENINTRSSKSDTIPFDWYTKQSITLELDSTYLFYAMYNIERDNGLDYYSYEVRFETTYFAIKRYFDTEKDIDIYTSSVYYPLLKYFKLGYDFSYVSKEENHNIYIGFVYKDWISAECAFLTEILRYQIMFKPSITLWEKLSIGPSVNIISVDDVIKWSIGLNLNIKFFFFFRS